MALAGVGGVHLHKAADVADPGKCRSSAPWRTTQANPAVIATMLEIM